MIRLYPVQYQIPGAQMILFRDGHGTALTGQVLLRHLALEVLAVLPFGAIPILLQCRNSLRAIPADPTLHGGVPHSGPTRRFPHTQPSCKIFLHQRDFFLKSNFFSFAHPVFTPNVIFLSALLGAYQSVQRWGNANISLGTLFLLRCFVQF